MEGFGGKIFTHFYGVFFWYAKKISNYKVFKKKAKKILKRNLIHPIFSYQRINAFLQNLQANSSSLKKVQNSQILAGNYN